MSSKLPYSLSRKVEKFGHTFLTRNVFPNYWKKEIKGERLKLLLEMKPESVRKQVNDKLEDLSDVVNETRSEFGVESNRSLLFNVEFDSYKKEGKKNKKKIKPYQREALKIVKSIGAILDDDDWYELIP
jgi:hypothetical protein